MLLYVAQSWRECDAGRSN